MSYVIYECKDSIARIILNRPELHNAFDDQFIAELKDNFIKAAKDTSAKLVVLSALGKSFSAGGDLNWMKKQKDAKYNDNLKDAEKLGDMLSTLNELPKPTIAMINGNAYGGGVGLAACCDIVIAAEEAKFCLSEVKLGLAASMIGPFVLRKIGYSNARRYFLTAEVFDANRAKELGLVHEVTKYASLTKTIDEFCQQILKNGPEAQAASKELIDYMLHTYDKKEIHKRTSEVIANRRASEEGQEGMTAFLEKRAPKWVS